MSDSESFRSAKVQSRATIWAAIIGSIGVVAAACIGLGVGRNQGEDQIAALREELRQRNAEIEALRGELQSEKATPEQTRKPGTSQEDTQAGSSAGGGESSNLHAHIGDVEFRIDRVQHTGQELQIWLIATNEGANLETGIHFHSSVTDASGNEHRQSARMAGGKRGGADWFSLTFPHRVPTRFGLAFDSVQPTTDSIPYMYIRLRDLGEIEFRQIPVPYEA
jgi:hypothetical protein